MAKQHEIIAKVYILIFAVLIGLNSYFYFWKIIRRLESRSLHLMLFAFIQISFIAGAISNSYKIIFENAENIKPSDSPLNVDSKPFMREIYFYIISSIFSYAAHSIFAIKYWVISK